MDQYLICSIKLGVISYSDSVDEYAVMEAAMEAGADDIVTHDDGSVDVMTSPEDYLSVKEAMVAAVLNLKTQK